MKIIVDVVDFGDIRISESTDNPDCVRMDIDFVEEGSQTLDLTVDEVDELIEALHILRDIVHGRLQR